MSSKGNTSFLTRLLVIVSWAIALALVAFAGYLGWKVLVESRQAQGNPSQVAVAKAPEQPQGESAAPASLPAVQLSSQVRDIYRKALTHTIIPERPSENVKSYTVSTGDSVFEIAAKFKIKPETLLWANYDQLNDNPDTIGLGMELAIPPVDGVYYQWQKGDTIEAVAGRFEANVDDILGWSGNKADLTNPTFEPGTWVMVPKGHREFRQWVIPVIPRGRAGVSKSVYGEGACEGGYDGAYGTGGFVWPAGNHSLSGNDYWSGHLGIDIAAGEGAPVYTSDSGVVVFAGWATGGYGYTVVVDHGNGYQTLYAHLSSIAASCGRSVGQGQTIGYAGSTGNSTGAHLHFEVRYEGGFVSPWYVLPAP
jgi:LysM repeat protein